MVFPVVLGRGGGCSVRRARRMERRLTESKPVGPDGVLVLIYERSRP